MQELVLSWRDSVPERVAQNRIHVFLIGPTRSRGRHAGSRMVSRRLACCCCGVLSRVATEDRRGVQGHIHAPMDPGK